jgi:hypothetical protein
MSGPAPAIHSVHIYEEASSLILRLCGIVGSSLRRGNAAIIVATADHRNRLVKGLRETGIDVRAKARAGRFIMVDAKEMLSTFMVNDAPDRELFQFSLGELLTKAGPTAGSKPRGLTVFGEMVAVLWEEGNREAALHLEELWNEALSDRAFHLHCAYPRSGFVNDLDEHAVCSRHSHTIADLDTLVA